MKKSELLSELERLKGDPEIPDWENLAKEIVQDLQLVNADANFINKEQLINQRCGEAAGAVQRIRDRCHTAFTRYKKFIQPKPQEPTDEQASKV